MMPREEMRDRIAALVEEAKISVPSSRQLVMVAERLRALPDVDVVDLVHVRDHEYEIKVMLLEHLKDEIVALERIAPLELAAAPQVVGLIPISDTQSDGVSILRYAACPGERFLQVDKTQQPFRPKAAERFRADMRKLADNGLMHPYVRGLFHWHVSSQTGTIVLDQWVALRSASEESLQEMLRTVDGLLASRNK